jgi:hypothetical protein
MFDHQSCAFNALCELSSRERWCWRIYCTTCGHMLFRYALRQLANGDNPTSKNWLIHANHPVLKRGAPLKSLGLIPPLGSWPMDEQKRLSQILCKANLENIAANCTFPDWLGYLGLAIKYTEEVEVGSRLITQSWVPQLASLVQPETSAKNMLARLEQDPSSTLTWRDLAVVETSLRLYIF